MLGFMVAYKLKVVNPYFKKEDHLMTFKSGIAKVQIDDFLIKADNRRMCRGYKVTSSEYLGIHNIGY